MNKLPMILTAFGVALAMPAFAGDAAKGENDFKKCASCHAIIATDGTAVRKGGKTGPNLFGVIGRQIGSVPDFPYGASLKAAGADGSVWDEAALASYVADPTAWLKQKTGDSGAKSNMVFKLGKDGADIASYLALAGSPGQ
jgi:cytochrome c